MGIRNENNFKAKVSKAKQTNKQKIKLIHKRMWTDKHITLEKSTIENCFWGASLLPSFFFTSLAAREFAGKWIEIYDT